MTALLLLLPGTPMLFQGQEFWASTPFYYFADHQGSLADMVRTGRAQSLAQFPSIADPACAAFIPAPDSLSTFEQCRLDWDEADRHTEIVALHRDLMTLRRQEPALSAQTHGRLHGTVIGPEAFALRFFSSDGARDALLFVNFGRDLRLHSISDPLAAPPRGVGWTVAWSSENPHYGGSGTPPLESSEGWRIPGHAAVLLIADALAQTPA